MLLDSVNSPADLRKLDYEQLDQLATEIRQFIVEAVAATSGHLGSNLGAVELTLAVHRVFDSPRDIVLWDTGHQAYVHKIVTGRKDRFSELRQTDGLSGYPSRAESEHDWVENSHASTILSYAHGIATAVESAKTDRKVVAIIGDGSMTGGMAFEGLNNLGHSGKRVVIILNDNGRSYAPTISKLSESVTRLRLNPSYVSLSNRIEAMLRDLPAVGELAYSGLQGMKAALREVLEPTAFFEALGVRYTGPIDGHDVEGLEAALRDAAAYDGPIVVHVLTHKGRGYAPAEDDDEKNLHDAPVFDPLVGPPVGWSAPKGYTQAFTDSLCELAAKHPQIVAITAAMPGPTGLLPFQARFPDRFFDVGIAEQHAITSAAGMAMAGLRPVVAVYSTFFTRAFDQAMYDVGLHGQPVVFAMDRAGITGPDGASHHGVLDLALCLKIPGMTVFAPSSAQELKVQLATAVDLDGPASIRYPRTAARHVADDQVGEGLKARKVRDGADVCIIAVGKMVEAAEEAARLLAAEGIDAAIWDPRVVKPLDQAMLLDAAKHQLVVTVEDGTRVGGAGAYIADAIASLDEHRTPPRVVILGVPAEFIPFGDPNTILANLGLDADGIASAVRKAAAPVRAS
ncbi:MAG TPA: 1-deoxy-D-xylulose-5-phosphate synthase [Acidimicrobiales bacterium]|jgi:1-deoxy-D-xylulose-5-phosphate synthase|nr:1-deoxy-D-xylulose-5-phosphate synthase [Acidimicrobiales bacterium]